jgi:hypothetical protein
MKAIHTGLPKVGFIPVNANQVNAITNIVPDMRGLTRDRAIQTLQDAGLDVVIAKTDAPPDQLTPAGYVAAQTPAGGTLSLPTGSVTLKLTAGSDVTVRIPPRAGANPTMKPPAPGPITDIGGGITGNKKLPVFPRPSPTTP